MTAPSTNTGIFRVRTGGNNANGGYYDATISGAGTDYSVFDAAQAAASLGTAAGTTTFTDVGALFTSAMVGNGLFIASGAGFTVGMYLITAFTSSTSIILDRSPGTGSAAVWKIGGAWADPWTNFVSHAPAGFLAYVRGNNSGTPSDNPTNVDYTATTFFTPVSGSTTAGFNRFIGENGRPFISTNQGLVYFATVMCYFENFKFRATGVALPGYGFVHVNSSSARSILVNVSMDQNNQDVSCIGAQSRGALAVFDCEIYSNTGSGGSLFAVETGASADLFVGLYVHDTKGPGVRLSNTSSNAPKLRNSIIAKCNGDGVTLVNSNITLPGEVSGCTIDGNIGHGITSATAAVLASFDVFSNLVTNNKSGGTKYGINVGAGTTAVNDKIKGYWDFNWLFGNDNTYNTISAGAHDTAGTDPLYTDQSNQDYTLQSTSSVIGKGFSSGAAPAAPIGTTPALYATLQASFLRRSVTPTITSYQDTGAAQRVMATGGGMIMSRLQAGM